MKDIFKKDQIKDIKNFALMVGYQAALFSAAYWFGYYTSNKRCTEIANKWLENGSLKLFDPFTGLEEGPDLRIKSI